jgi:hypothetical protein
MGGKRKRRERGAIIDSAAKVAMLAALREGRRLDEVAACYGVTLQAFYSARRRDPLFAAAWQDAHALSAEAERRCLSTRPSASPVALPDTGSGRNGERRISSNNRRLLQRRGMRHVRFDERRKGVFLAHFARSCDFLAAAAAAGVCERTVYNHLHRDPAFADALQTALKEGYAWLETEALRQRLEAQERLRAAWEDADEGEEELLREEEGVEFDRAMKLLARWDRKNGGLGPRQVGHGRRRPWSFEETIALIDKKLDNLGIPRLPPPEGTR